MSVTQTAIPENYRDLLDGPIVASLATLLPDGSPQLTPVWCDYDGRYIRVNTSLSRQKYKDMAARPHVAVLVIDPHNPFRYVEIRGVVAKPPGKVPSSTSTICPSSTPAPTATPSTIPTTRACSASSNLSACAPRAELLSMHGQRRSVATRLPMCNLILVPLAGQRGSVPAIQASDTLGTSA